MVGGDSRVWVQVTASGSRGNGWQVFMSALLLHTMSHSWSQLVPTVTHPLHASSFIQCPSSYSTPGSLPYSLLSLQSFELHYTWNKHSVAWSQQSSQMPVTLGKYSSCGWTQWLPLLKGPGGWAGRAAPQTLQSFWKLPFLMAALLDLVKNGVCIWA